MTPTEACFALIQDDTDYQISPLITFSVCPPSLFNFSGKWRGSIQLIEQSRDQDLGVLTIVHEAAGKPPRRHHRALTTLTPGCSACRSAQLLQHATCINQLAGEGSLHVLHMGRDCMSVDSVAHGHHIKGYHCSYYTRH